MVGSTSAPVAGLVNRTAACPGSTVPPWPSASRASWSASARSVYSHRYASNGEPGEPGAYRAALNGLFAQRGGENIDTIVLACTHFPLVEDELAAAAPSAVRFVDGKDALPTDADVQKMRPKN